MRPRTHHASTHPSEYPWTDQPDEQLDLCGSNPRRTSLSFLGMGIQPPNPSWGNLIRDGVAVILQAPWMAVVPGLALTLSVLASNMIGSDSLRDMLDPQDIALSTEKKLRNLI
ncbi:hypothetical protein LHFGNBLO_005937 (plasmid) [Mesorhizobium sp. AR10]|uniref:hypothetical protein n=1 Tax=Mesorhizobium sp. AR10 TaxID=2865839 RepID=UPI002160FEAE|nr:hypothetical protein [Mesorhizobium sp. AR10]UVK35751.1 hypothetical protein LHFGNBLO_005937 [Mesorhizobium sp. AR10]